MDIFLHVLDMIGIFVISISLWLSLKTKTLAMAEMINEITPKAVSILSALQRSKSMHHF